MARFRVELEGFEPLECEAANKEAAWDAYKAARGPAVRRQNHNKAPVVLELPVVPEAQAPAPVRAARK